MDTPLDKVTKVVLVLLGIATAVALYFEYVGKIMDMFRNYLLGG